MEHQKIFATNLLATYGQKEIMIIIGKQNQQTYKQKKSLNIFQI